MTKQKVVGLKPCPFCGGVAVIREDISHSTGVFFGCNTSGCLGADMWEESASEAISAWNTRADLPQTMAEAMRCPEVKALVEALHYYADFHENPNDGPWGLASDDYGKVAREALIKLYNKNVDQND